MKSSATHPPRRRLFGPVAALLALAVAAGPAAACGSGGGIVQPISVNERGEVALADGRLVRLAGVDLPTPGRGDPALAAAARELLTARLVGREATLSLVSAAPDRWERALGDLAAPAAEGEPASAADALLVAGLARVRPEFETRGCEAARLALESAARAKMLGVWRDPDYAVLAGDDASLARRDGRFVVVEGVVRRVGLGRSRLYLNLGGRRAVSVVVPLKSPAALQAAGGPLTALAGEKVRARGVLDNRFGPQLEVVDPLMLERLGRAETK